MALRWTGTGAELRFHQFDYHVRPLGGIIIITSVSFQRVSAEPGYASMSCRENTINVVATLRLFIRVLYGSSPDPSRP